MQSLLINSKIRVLFVDLQLGGSLGAEREREREKGREGPGGTLHAEREKGGRGPSKRITSSQKMNSQQFRAVS